MSRFIDITRPVDATLPLWPGHSSPILKWDKRIDKGDHCSASSWQMSPHTGTHLDSPLHFISSGASIDRIPPEFFFGSCTVVDLRATPGLRMDIDLASRFLGVKRLIFRSLHSDTSQESAYPDHGQLLTSEAASLLLEKGLLLVGTDRLSVDDSSGGDFTLHQLILGAGSVILEGLQLVGVSPGRYTLFAAPLRLSGMEASPVRAYLVEE